jgi:unsaturated rhamnogalacturonyl hydrolase
MKYKYTIVTFLSFAALTCSFKVSSQAGDINKSEVYALLKKVANWQIKTPLKYATADWTNGALFTGMAEWAGIAKEDTYYGWLKEAGEKVHWTYNQADKNPLRRYHADDYCIGQMYVELYRRYKQSEMIAPMKAYFDQIMANPSTVDLKFVFTDSYWSTERWSWCDALFMGPTVWAKMANVTGNPKYLDFMLKEYKVTTDYLYSKENHLFFRDSRYFDTTEANGARMFWGRGNGWVFAGLPIIIRELPKNYDQKAYFVNLYREMAAKILSLQDTSGYWHASLLDPASYPNPEMSATGFFMFGLAWGINNGYLDRKTYLPAVIRGWNAMQKAVLPDGKVGWIQPIGENPKKVTRDMTEVYGVGAFLLAGTEIYKLKDKN